MKRIIINTIIGVCAAMVACGMVTSCTTTYAVSTVSADITWMNDNGEVVRQFDHARISSQVVVSNGFGAAASAADAPGRVLDNGLEFFDNETQSKTYISGGMIYCRFYQENEVIKESSAETSTETKSKTSAELEEMEASISSEIASLKQELQQTTKGTGHYEALSSQIKSLKVELRKIQDEIYYREMNQR